MKERATNYNNGKKPYKKKWTPKYDSAGFMHFEVYGFVQKVESGKTLMGECDFVTFQIDNPYVKGNINAISIEVYHNLPQLEEGDEVTIKGNIRSWWNEDINRVVYTYIAEKIDDYEATRDNTDTPDDVYYEDEEESKYQKENEDYRRKRGNYNGEPRRITKFKHPWEE